MFVENDFSIRKLMMEEGGLRNYLKDYIKGDFEKVNLKDSTGLCGNIRNSLGEVFLKPTLKS